MPNAEVLRVALTLVAPAFFLFFGLATLGAPFLAMICFAAARSRRTQHPEMYARRLVRMALSCGLPTFIILLASVLLATHRISWLADWLLAAPLIPSLFVVGALAYCASLLVQRLSSSRHHAGGDNRLLQTAILSLLSLGLLWLLLLLLHSFAAQTQAVLEAPSENGVSVATLVRPDIAEAPPLLFAAFLALIPLASACAGACSLEYMLLLREREPFGREAFAHALKLAARSTLRSTLLAGALLPVLWSRLSGLPADAQAAKPLLLGTGAALLTACLLWALLARSTRPYSRTMLVHTSMLLVWTALTCLLSAGLLCLYAT